jgi:hypothetical protein
MNKLEINELNEESEKLKLPFETIKTKEKLLKLELKYKNIKSSKKILLIIFKLIALIIILLNLVYFSIKKNIFMNNKSYDEKGIEIYKKKGILSFNELDKQFKRYNDTNNNKTFNHIHIAMSFNDDYSLLSSVTIASLLKNADKNTYIHLHIITVDNFGYSWMKKLNSLKYKINNNTEFIFHNGDRVEKDFGTDIKNDSKGMPEFSRFLAPYCANDTDRIIVTDSADLLIEKDLLELYNYPLEDKLVKGVIDPYTNCFPDYQTFHKENYFNGGVLLFNSKRWREMNLYQDIPFLIN